MPDPVACTASQGEYPNPPRHLDGMAPATPPAGLEELLRRYARQVEIVVQARMQEDRLRHQAVERLKTVPDRSLRTDKGEWTLTDDEGEPILTWVPR